MPRENLMPIVTGSQGERRRGPRQRLSRNQLPRPPRSKGRRHVPVSPPKPSPATRWASRGSRTPLAEKGVDVIDDSHGFYHVSGHANRPRPRGHCMTSLRPQIVIPITGEYRHLREHANWPCPRARPGFIAANCSDGGTVGKMRRGSSTMSRCRKPYPRRGRLVGALDGVIRDLDEACARTSLGGGGVDRRRRRLAAGRQLGAAARSPRGDERRVDLAEMIEDELAEAMPRFSTSRTVGDGTASWERRCAASTGRYASPRSASKSPK